ncbi:N-acetylglucosamine repressor [Marinithermofilum abyssi]|uniref:N-acetylglucosamine repressor n=1 Tax=Marinithermofilum abyssi TaxID=1571185 RepID=A0A8J2YE25_9BACL|nr:ROK family transcriptional regulator [Marinithermofilum abyssi]GGE16961.1 N-acetylglucosamine repressor [Marinithermofilum abyssi]
MPRSMQIGSFRWMKSINKSAILNVIRLHGPISRAEIAKHTKLTPPTVTNIVAELLESRLVVESDLGQSTGGRKPIMLTINAEAFCVVGVYAGAKRVQAVSADLNGNILEEAELPIPTRPEADVFIAIVKEAVKTVIQKAREQSVPILGIGVGMHGLVDPDKGISIFAPNLGLKDIPLRTLLEKEFDLPVEVENDVRALALGESWFGQGKDVGDFIVVNVGTGVGAGIMLEHRLIHGPSFTAGELGHTVIDLDGPPCSCGNHGCVEAFASGPAMAKRALARIREGIPSSLSGRVEAGASVTGKDICRAAEEGDPLARKVLAETGRYLGIGLANLVNLFNPTKIILSGGVIRAGDFVLEPLKETVKNRALSVPAKEVSITVSELGTHAQAIGAFTLVLQKMFEPMGQ